MHSVLALIVGVGAGILVALIRHEDTLLAFLTHAAFGAAGASLGVFVTYADVFRSKRGIKPPTKRTYATLTVLGTLATIIVWSAVH